MLIPVSVIGRLELGPVLLEREGVDILAPRVLLSRTELSVHPDAERLVDAVLSTEPTTGGPTIVSSSAIFTR